MKDFIQLSPDKFIQLSRHIVFVATQSSVIRGISDLQRPVRCLAVGRGTRGIKSIARFVPAWATVQLYPCPDLQSAKILERELIRTLKPITFQKRRSFSLAVNAPVDALPGDPVPVAHGRKPKHLIPRSKSLWSPRSREKE